MVCGRGATPLAKTRERCLPAVERLSVFLGCIGLHSTQAQDGTERVSVNQGFSVRWISPIRWSIFQWHISVRQGEEEIRRSEIGDLVFEDEMIAERVPSQIGNCAMILVQIKAIVCEYKIRGKSLMESNSCLILAPSQEKNLSRNCRIIIAALWAPFGNSLAPFRLPFSATWWS